MIIDDVVSCPDTTLQNEDESSSSSESEFSERKRARRKKKSIPVHSSEARKLKLIKSSPIQPDSKAQEHENNKEETKIETILLPVETANEALLAEETTGKQPKRY